MRVRMYKEVPARIPRSRLERLFAAVTRGERRRKGEINIVFTGADQIRGLNKRFRDRNEATDVLAFPMCDTKDGDEGETYGEVYIAIPIAEAQAAECGVNLSDELLRLTCHGLLHLFGYDHHTRPEAEEMRRREDRYLSAVRGR